LYLSYLEVEAGCFSDAERKLLEVVERVTHVRPRIATISKFPLAV
jgi:hypothetical protein